MKANTEWFPKLVNDCKKIRDEGFKASSTVLLSYYYKLGERIDEDYTKFGTYEYGGFTQQNLAEQLSVKQWDVSNAYRWKKMVDARYGSYEQFIVETITLPVWDEIIRKWLPYARMLDEDFDPNAESKLQTLRFPDSDFINEQAAREFFQRYGGSLLGRFYYGKVNPELYKKEVKLVDIVVKPFVQKTELVGD